MLLVACYGISAQTVSKCAKVFARKIEEYSHFAPKAGRERWGAPPGRGRGRGPPGRRRTVTVFSQKSPIIFLPDIDNPIF
jgi:hypothetical protein